MACSPQFDMDSDGLCDHLDPDLDGSGFPDDSEFNVIFVGFDELEDLDPPEQDENEEEEDEDEVDDDDELDALDL